MATPFTTSNLSSAFLTFREILKTVTNLTNAKTEFSNNDHYYEFDPRVKSLNFKGYPFFLIETDVDDAAFTLKTTREYHYYVPITLFIEYHARANLKTYLGHVLSHLNNNRQALYTDYNIDEFTIDVSYDTEVIASELIAKGTLGVKFNVVRDW